MVAKAIANISKSRLAALILDRIVEESGNGHIFGSAILENGGGDREEVRNIRCRFTLAHLAAVHTDGIQQRAIKAIRTLDPLIKSQQKV